MNIIDFAYQVIEMQERITELEMKNEQLIWYKEEYNKLLDSSLQHNQEMISNMFKLCMTPGVIEACQQNNTLEVK